TLVESAGEGGRAAAVAGSALLDHIQAPPAAFGLLAGVRTAESLGEAIAMRGALSDGESVVTRDGFWVGRHWLRIRRSDDPQVGVLARGEEIKRLKAAVEHGTGRTEELARALADPRARLEMLEQAQVAAQAEATQRQDALGEIKSKLAACRGELEQTRTRAATLDASIAELAAEQAQLGSALEDARQRHGAASDSQRELA